MSSTVVHRGCFPHDEASEASMRFAQRAQTERPVHQASFNNLLAVGSGDAAQPHGFCADVARGENEWGKPEGDGTNAPWHAPARKRYKQLLQSSLDETGEPERVDPIFRKETSAEALQYRRVCGMMLHREAEASYGLLRTTRPTFFSKLLAASKQASESGTAVPGPDPIDTCSAAHA